MAGLCLPSDHVFCDCRLSAIVQARIVRGFVGHLYLIWLRQSCPSFFQDRCQARRSPPTSRLHRTYLHDAQLDYFRIAYCSSRPHPFDCSRFSSLSFIQIRVEHRTTLSGYIPMRSSQGGRKYAETSLLRRRCLSPAKAKESLPTIATSIWREHKHQYESVFQQALTRISEH
jgi:hypothetical protein